MFKKLTLILSITLASFFTASAGVEKTTITGENEKVEQKNPQPEKEIAPEANEVDANAAQVSESPAPVDTVNYGENAFQKFNFIFYFLYKYKYDNDPRYGNGLAPLGLESN